MDDNRDTRTNERQKISNRKSLNYRTLDQQIKTKCREATEEWLNTECNEIEQHTRNDPASMHWKIKEISGHRPTAFSSGCIQSKEGNIIKDKVLERWTKYLGELFKETSQPYTRTLTVQQF